MSSTVCGPGGRPSGSGAKKKNKDQDEIAHLKAQLEKLQESNKLLQESVARGGVDDQPQDDIVWFEKPPGEAGDKKNGFVLQDAMGLEDDKDLYSSIQRSMHKAVTRVHLDLTLDYCKQAPEKLGAVYKLMCKDHNYLTQKRFPFNWASAEMVKQYLRNQCRYAVKMQRLPARKEQRKQRTEGTSRAGASNQHHKTTGTIHHINDQVDQDEDEDKERSVGGEPGSDD
ncbi:hypothetical protein K438DRAFT_1964234 [Mycena galopus ATCC 62051]|nr:hypothetical protein K438DRAFT_1964234 [Mycena galopus ATCC 62051]